jgi:hypothetical protein
MSAKFQQVKGALEGMVVEAKKEFPFEEIIDEETGANVSEETFGGLVSFKVNADLMRAKQDPTFKVRTMQEVVRDAARGLNLMGSKTKGNGGADITESSLKEKHPEIVKSIEQNAIAGYLREQQGLPPSVRGKSGDAASAAQTAGDGKGKEWKNIDDAFDAAEKDKGLMDEVRGEISKTYRR